MGTDQLYERTQIELFPMSLFSTGKLSVIWMFYDFILYNSLKWISFVPQTICWSSKYGESRLFISDEITQYSQVQTMTSNLNIVWLKFLFSFKFFEHELEIVKTFFPGEKKLFTKNK